MTEAPYAPWVLTGESIAGLARLRGPRGPLPAGLERMPGPALIVAVRYTDSPVGAYHELAIGEPARLGVRPGWCITTMVVDSSASRLGGRLNWGFPKELGRLHWIVDGAERGIEWEERKIAVTARPRGVPLPGLFPVRSLQNRSDGPVVVPGRLRGLARFARLHVDVPGDDDLAGLGGRHLGVVVSGMRFTIHPARHPLGVTSTLRAPLRAPEPALFIVPVPSTAPLPPVGAPT